MSRLPNAVISIVAASAIGVLSYEVIESLNNGPDNTDRVLSCASHLGGEAVSATVLATDCAPYVSEFTPISVIPAKGPNQSLTYRVPTVANFLKKEFPVAEQADRTDAERQLAIGIATGLAVGAVGAVVYGGKRPKFRNPLRRNQSKNLSAV